MLRQLRHTPFRLLEPRGQALPVGPQPFEAVQHLLACILDITLPIPQVEPTPHSPSQAPQIRQGVGRSRRGSRHLLLGRAVLLHHLLNALVQIAARIQQILVGFLDLVLIEFHLGLRQLELVLDRAALRARPVRQRSRELIDRRLISFQQAL